MSCRNENEETSSIYTFSLVLLSGFSFTYASVTTLSFEAMGKAQGKYHKENGKRSLLSMNKKDNHLHKRKSPFSS